VAFPTARQELMLQAALGHGGQALAAWRAFARDTDVEQLDADSQWLMPLLYANLRGQGMTDPLLARCRNVYLHHWYRGQAALGALAGWLRASHGPAASVVVLRGAAMAVSYYGSVGARPIDSVDLWMPAGPRGDAAHAAAPDPLPSPLRRRARLLDGRVDAEVVRRATPVTVLGVSCATMSPGDQLLHLCAERDGWDARSRLLWLADVARLLLGPAPLDRRAVWALAERLGQSGTLVGAIDRLRRLDVLAPDGRWTPP
jgi:hypothetical protein